jgi:hypothetical protein
MLGSSGLYLKFVEMIGKLKAALLKCLLTPWFWISQKKKVRSRMGWHPSPIQLNVFLIESKERRRGLRPLDRDEWINGLVSDIEAYFTKRSEDARKGEE